MKRLALALAVLLSACAAPPAPKDSPHLRLSPASLGRSLALEQQLTVDAAGQTRTLQVMLETEPTSVRLAMLALGQTAATLEWDGTTLRQQHAAWWPDAIAAERVLDDLQLSLWPVDAVRAGLAPPWDLQVAGDERVLRRDGVPVVRVRVRGNVTDLEHLRDGYRIHIESHPLESTP